MRTIPNKPELSDSPGSTRRRILAGACAGGLALGLVFAGAGVAGADTGTDDGGTMSEHPEDMPIEELVAALRLDDLDTRTGSSEPLGTQPVTWRHLEDDDAREAWDALRDWVEWVTVRYDIPEVIIPPCWWRHGSLV